MTATIALIPRHNVRMPADTVSLARAPWEGDIMAHDPRPETYPRLTLVKPNPRRSVTPEGFIALLRAECLNARAGA